MIDSKKKYSKKKKNLSKMKKRSNIANNIKINKKNEQASFEIVVAGRSNVGKSTLVSLLTHKKLRTGKRPGVTLKPTHIYISDILITDLPGFGFMKSVSDSKSESVKEELVNYLEVNKHRIKIAIQVLDVKSFSEIVSRWDQRNEIPIDLELSSFILEMNIFLIIVINKIDNIKDENQLINKIQEIKDLYFKYLESINSLYTSKISIVSISCKNKDILPLINKIKLEIHKLKRDDLYKFFK